MNLSYEPEDIKIYLFGGSVDMRKQNEWITHAGGRNPPYESI